MARMRLTVDTSALDRDLQRALRRNPRHAQAAVRSRQLNVFRDSQREVPVDTSVLEQSGETPPPFLRGGRWCLACLQQRVPSQS